MSVSTVDAIWLCCRNTSPRMIWSPTAGTRAKGANPRPATNRPPGNSCKPGSTAARSVRRSEPAIVLAFLRRPAVGLGAGAAHQHGALTGAQAIRFQEWFDALLVVDDGES